MAMSSGFEGSGKLQGKRLNIATKIGKCWSVGDDDVGQVSWMNLVGHLDVGELVGYCLDTIWSVTQVESRNPQIQTDCKNIAVVREQLCHRRTYIHCRAHSGEVHALLLSFKVSF